MDFLSKRIPFLALAIFLLSDIAFAWGPGHDAIQKAVQDRLPAFLTQDLDDEYINQLIRIYSHYPDSFEPFDVSIIGVTSLKRLAKHNITKRYDLHQDRNRAIAFLELVHAIRESDNRKANFWIACLAHSAADMAAINHDPMTHVVYYLWGKEKKAIKTPKGNFPDYLDINDVASLPEGKRIFAEQINKMLLHDTGKELNETLANIMFYGHQGAHFLALRGFNILESSMAYADSQDPSQLSGLFKNMSDLGAWAVVRILRDVEIAVRLAGSNTRLEITSEAEGLYHNFVAEHLLHRKLDDGMFAAIQPYQANDNDLATGVLTEPSWRMNDGVLGFTERVLSFQISATLRKSQRAFRIFNVTEILSDGFPNPKTTPVMILPVRQKDKSYFWLDIGNMTSYLTSYLASGGRVIWIGGGQPPENVLPQLTGSMIPSGQNGWPVREMDKSILVPYNTSENWELSGELKPKVGWQTITCPYVFDQTKMKQAEVASFLTLLSPSGKKLHVGASWPAIHTKAIFLPSYSLVPFLWTQEEVLPVPVRDASLDKTGSHILDLALNLLSAP